MCACRSVDYARGRTKLTANALNSSTTSGGKCQKLVTKSCTECQCASETGAASVAVRHPHFGQKLLVRNLVYERHVQRQRLECDLLRPTRLRRQAHVTRAWPGTRPRGAPSLLEQADSVAGRSVPTACARPLVRVPRHKHACAAACLVCARDEQRAVLVLQPLQQRLLKMRLDIQLPQLKPRFERYRLLHEAAQGCSASLRARRRHARR